MPSVELLTVKFVKVTVHIVFTWLAHALRIVLLSSLTSEVLRLRLQALSLPIDGSRQQLISRLKAALTHTNRPARATANRATKPSRHTRRAKSSNAQKRVNPSAEDPTESADENRSADEDNAMLLDDGASSLDDLMSETSNAAPKSPASPFSDDQLRVLQHTVELSIEQALRNVRGQPDVPPAIPHALPSSRPAGTASPLGLHRPLDRSLEDKILRGEYVDLSLLLPDSLTHPQAPALQFRLEDSAPGSTGTPLTMVRKKKAVIDSFHKWVDAYTTFMLVLVTAYPRRAVELIKYLQIISKAEAKFRGLAWLHYDEQFRRRASQDLTLNWGLVDLELWTVTFSGQAKPHCFLCSSPYHSQADCPIADPARRPARSLGSTCYNFNKPMGCSRRACQFQHVCSRCRSPSHSILRCKSGQPETKAQLSSDRGKK